MALSTTVIAAIKHVSNSSTWSGRLRLSRMEIRVAARNGCTTEA